MCVGRIAQQVERRLEAAGEAPTLRITSRW